ncbi:MAG TPA: thioredoxin domain-containing protein, partial [Pirellulales bacterium]
MRSVHLLVVSLSLAILFLASFSSFACATDLSPAENFCPLPPSNTAAQNSHGASRYIDLRPAESNQTSNSSSANDTILYDFRADWCGPCRSMDPVVGQLLGEGYPIRRVNVDQDRELANRFGVQGIPCFVMVVNGKEVDRVVGATNISRLEAMFSRNGVDASPGTVRAQSPDPQNSRLDAIIARSRAPQAVPFPVTGAPADQQLTNSLGATAGLPSSVSQENTAPSDLNRKPIAPYDQLIRASVRLRIEDETGDSVGSGTIIDARAGEALIITCGHVFREAVKNGRISVDLFGPGAPKSVTGTLIDFDLKSEVGLISIRTNYPLVAAHLAPPGYIVHPNDPVISIGCDGGADATIKETRVTSLNRYVGAPNLQVAFQPVQGRSGGGLFTPEGFVIGVCYAADPEAHEGLFAALAALCNELDRVKLG